MSADGFFAIVFVDEIQRGTGRTNSGSYNSASLEMSGTIREIAELDIKKTPSLRTYVRVLLSVIGEDSFVPRELENTCIGDMSVKQYEEPASDLEHHVRVVIRASVSSDVYDHLVSLHTYPFRIEPVFYREGDATEKKVRNSPYGNVSYIQRIHLSPILPTRDA